MAQVKIYGRRGVWGERRGSVSDALHRRSSAPGGLPQDKRFHRFLLLDDDDLVAPRSDDYLVVEIVCFTGRTREARRAPDRRVLRRRRARPRAGRGRPRDHDPREPAENWGIRGRHGDELR